ncbi:NAD(+) diphosphatase [Gilvimarinus chinensis]|uniref:NAD(+) diphosphatase n=1 Tax=Gilvimarinus chinensis TaxID=396005 RepID=UPI0003A22BCD|nr:NAD(+) diphosphatase [Gilvimarinus chinensis]
MQPNFSKLWLVKNGSIGVDSSGNPIHEVESLREGIYLPLTASDSNDYALLLKDDLVNSDVQWVSLRECLFEFNEQQILSASQAVQLSHWFYSHRFCSCCGTALGLPHAEDLKRKEMVLRCNACDSNYYPRVSPCIIVLIKKEKSCLLARHKRSHTAVYTTLAGFIEAGESAEQAVIREVREEVGIEVNNLTFHSSQSWPFPGQLMLGFYADYADGEISLQEEEIVDANWFESTNLPEIPPSGTIARRLIDGFLERCKSQGEEYSGV